MPSDTAPNGRFNQRERLDVADAIGGADLTEGERLVCLAVLLFWFGNDQSCCPGDRAIERIARVSLRTINRARERAEEAGVMRSKRVGKGPLTYTFHVPSDDTCQTVSRDITTSHASALHVTNEAVSHATGSACHVPSTARASEKDSEKDPEKEAAAAPAHTREDRPTDADPPHTDPVHGGSADPWRTVAAAVVDAYVSAIEERAGVLPRQPPPKDGAAIVEHTRAELPAADRDDPAKVTAAALRVTLFFATGFPSDRNMPPLWRLANYDTFRRQWDMAQEGEASTARAPRPAAAPAFVPPPPPPLPPVRVMTAEDRAAAKEGVAAALAAIKAAQREQERARQLAVEEERKRSLARKAELAERDAVYAELMRANKKAAKA